MTDLDAANERARLILDAKNHWMDRAVKAEAELRAARAALNAVKWRLYTIRDEDRTWERAADAAWHIANDALQGLPEPPDYDRLSKP